MYYPKIKIFLSDKNYNSDVVADTLIDGLKGNNKTLPFVDRVYKILPELRGQINVCMKDFQIRSLVRKEIYRKYTINYDEMVSRVSRLQKIIDSRVYEAVRVMIEEFNVKWPDNQDIYCFLGFYNPFPRSVLSCRYYLHYDVNDEVVVKSSLHEINHFILFKKWQSMNGYNSKDEPEFPSPLWFLEELAVEASLNSPQIFSMTFIKERSYEIFHSSLINGVSIQQNINNIFMNSTSVEEFLNEAYNFIVTNYNEILEECS